MQQKLAAARPPPAGGLQQRQGAAAGTQRRQGGTSQRKQGGADQRRQDGTTQRFQPTARALPRNGATLAMFIKQKPSTAVAAPPPTHRQQRGAAGKENDKGKAVLCSVADAQEIAVLVRSATGRATSPIKRAMRTPAAPAQAQRSDPRPLYEVVLRGSHNDGYRDCNTVAQVVAAALKRGWAMKGG